MKLATLKDLYVEQLRDIYSAEKQILKALPLMAERASNDELKTAFTQHEEQTRVHTERLEQVFESLGEKAKAEHCQGMEGLLKEGQHMMGMKGDPDVIDAGLITAAQRVEHYEIAAYGSVRTYAERLGFRDQADLLQRTLDEEGKTDHRLTAIAEKVVNPKAMS
jgi:ferritin-like metal-binding protein YciE